MIDRPVRVSPRGPSLPRVGSPPSDPFTGADVPVYQIPQPSSPAALDLIRSLAPDVIVVACFPRIIPREVRAIPRFGAINIHPSLLPCNRGPDPLFWTLREGDGRAGVTVHELTDRLDAGPILAQQAVHYADGTPESELELALAQTGAECASDVIRSLAAGTATPALQDESLASYQSWPTDDDFIIDTYRPARAAFNFIRGIQHRGMPVRILTHDTLLTVAESLSHSKQRPHPHEVPAGVVAVAFNPGWLLIRPASGS